MLNSKKYLHFLILAYIFVYFLPFWADARQINIFGLTTGRGTLVFPFTFLIVGMITEIYGYKNTKIVIWTGLLFQALFLVYGKFIAHFISPVSGHTIALTSFVKVNNWIMIASLANYIISENVNAYLIARLKVRLRGRLIGIRFLIATLMAYLIDELIYAPIAFHRFISHKQLLWHMLDSWILMVGIELVMLPIAVRIAIVIKKREHMDIYDTITNFNPFSLNTDYRTEDNKYQD
jgi:uncharacterized integral membrane protein (TIGR00697 family)